LFCGSILLVCYRGGSFFVPFIQIILSFVSMRRRFFLLFLLLLSPYHSAGTAESSTPRRFFFTFPCRRSDAVSLFFVLFSTAVRLFCFASQNHSDLADSISFPFFSPSSPFPVFLEKKTAEIDGGTANTTHDEGKQQTQTGLAGGPVPRKQVDDCERACLR